MNKWIIKKKAEDDNELKRSDFEIYKEDGYYKVRPITDKGQNAHIYTSFLTSKKFMSTDNKLNNEIYKYNKKHIYNDVINKRTVTIKKLHKLFAEAGLQRYKETTTSIRGFHYPVNYGYEITTNGYDLNKFNINLYVGENSFDKYINIITNILQQENLQYSMEYNQSIVVTI